MLQGHVHTLRLMGTSSVSERIDPKASRRGGWDRHISDRVPLSRSRTLKKGRLPSGDAPAPCSGCVGVTLGVRE